MKTTMKSKILFIALIGVSLTIHSQTKIGFDINDAFNVSGNSVAHYGMSRISGNDYHYVGLSGFFGLNFYTNGKERIKVNRDGYVGIGTTNPAYELHVSSGVQLRKTTIGVTKASPENSWIRDDWLTGNYGPPKWNQDTAKWIRPAGSYNDVGGIIYQDEGTYFIRDYRGPQLEYTNNELLGKAYLFAHIVTGNVGIGTTTPDYKLTVKGKIHSREVKVTATAGGADFVFEKEYDLPTLLEVEQFISKNKHLPEIASAKEMEKNGIHLAEMNIKLLQKIEELTLYTIEHQKKIEKLSSLKKENELLQKKFDTLESFVLKMINK